MADKLEEALDEVWKGLKGANEATAAFTEKLKAFRAVGDELALQAIRRELGEQYEGVPIIQAIRKIKADLGMAQVDAKAQAGIAEMRNDKIAQMKRALDNYKTDLEEARKVNGDIYLRYVEAESLANRRNAELTAKSEELAALRGELRDLRQSRAKLQSIVDYTATEADKLGDKYAHATGDLAERDRMINELRDALKGERLAAGTKIGQLERELKAADGHYQSLARACVAQAVEITRLKEPK